MPDPSLRKCSTLLPGCLRTARSNQAPYLDQDGADDGCLGALLSLSLRIWDFLCFSNHSTVVSGRNSIGSYSREALLTIRESSLGIFSPSFIHPSFTEFLASGAAALRRVYTPPKALKGEAYW
ncbi:hypothetical protein CHARACLAT_028842 [Characodon lateralis]|uniref:Uncharacterized protein n=1 Tax=Characodon lateralis TaxID=208331 RepID=A0ABU7E8L8_9TELE|nr:hypothetical protein [Characodon lateralis]